MAPPSASPLGDGRPMVLSDAQLAALKQRKRFSASWSDRDSQRRSRRRRKEWLHIMREMLDAHEAELQRALAGYQTDARASSLRHRYCDAAVELQRLRWEKCELEDKLLAFHALSDDLRVEVAMSSIASLTISEIKSCWVLPSDDECLRMAREAYSSLASLGDCNPKTPVAEVDYLTLGWESEHTGTTYRFAKALDKVNAAQVVERAWTVGRDEPWGRTMLGGAIKTHIDEIKRVSDDLAIVHVLVEHAAREWAMRSVCLCYRIVSDDSSVVLWRSLPKAGKHPEATQDCWADFTTWMEVAPCSRQDTSSAKQANRSKVTWSGTWHGSNGGELQLSASELLQLVLEWEYAVIGPIITLP